MHCLCYCQDELVDTDGYRYTLKVDKRRPGITWRCSQRNQELTCKATVHDRLGFYVRGGQPHVCDAHPGMCNSPTLPCLFNVR